MAASTALRLLLGASLGLGALDLAWIDLALAPRATATETDARAAAPSVPALHAAVAEPAAVPPAPEPAPPVSPAAGSVDEQVHFATQSATLDPSARALVERLAASASASTVFVLEGHADYRGGESLNRTLSKDRAHAVADYLARLGVPPARIRVRWVGKDGATASDELWRDRRVDIHVGGEP